MGTEDKKYTYWNLYKCVITFASAIFYGGKLALDANVLARAGSVWRVAAG